MRRKPTHNTSFASSGVIR